MHSFSRPLFNPKEVNLIDICLALKNSGYECSIRDFEFAVEHKAFIYTGFTATKNYRYAIAFYNDMEGDCYYIADIFLYISATGFMCADYGGNPISDNLTKEQALAEMERLKSAHNNN